MKTATLDVGGMLSMLDYQGVERQLAKMAGVQRAMASIASSSATVEYDEAVTSGARPRDTTNECASHCTGQIMPKNIWEPQPGHVEEHAMQVDRGAPMKHLDPRAPGHHPAHTPVRARAAETPAVPVSHDMAH